MSQESLTTATPAAWSVRPPWRPRCPAPSASGPCASWPGLRGPSWGQDQAPGPGLAPPAPAPLTLEVQVQEISRALESLAVHGAGRSGAPARWGSGSDPVPGHQAQGARPRKLFALPLPQLGRDSSCKAQSTGSSESKPVWKAPNYPISLALAASLCHYLYLCISVRGSKTGR